MLSKFLLALFQEAVNSQRVLGVKITEALDEETGALLESPTGTGKTLAILTAVLEWVQQRHTQQQEHAAMMTNGNPLLRRAPPLRPRVFFARCVFSCVALHCSRDNYTKKNNGIQAEHKIN